MSELVLKCLLFVVIQFPNYRIKGCDGDLVVLLKSCFAHFQYPRKRRTNSSSVYITTDVSGIKTGSPDRTEVCAEEKSEAEPNLGLSHIYLQMPIRTTGRREPTAAATRLTGLYFLRWYRVVPAAGLCVLSHRAWICLL